MFLRGQWAIEFKLIRPFYDNGNEAEHWSENLLHPYPGNVSAIGDVLRLYLSEFEERKGIAVIVYEHSPPKVNIDLAIDAFDLLLHDIFEIKLGEKVSATCTQLIHPVHQQARVHAWEIPNATAAEKFARLMKSLTETERKKALHAAALITASATPNQENSG